MIYFDNSHVWEFYSHTFVAFNPVFNHNITMMIDHINGFLDNAGQFVARNNLFAKLLFSQEL